MSYDTLTALPIGGAQNQSVVTFTYPSGRTSEDYESKGASVSINGGEYEARQSTRLFSLIYGPSSIQLIWKGARIANGKLWTLRAPLTRETQVAAATPKPIFGSMVDLLGTSHTDMNSKWILPGQANPSSAWMSDGYFTHFQQLSGQRLYCPLSNNKGVSGNNMLDMLARLGDLLSTTARFTVFEVGSNDLTNSDPSISSFASMKANWLAIVTCLIQAGRTVIVIPITPRAGSFLTSVQLFVQMQFTNWQREWCYTHDGVIFVDYLPYWLDQTSTTSVPLAGMVKTNDNLHETSIGAYWIGRAMHEFVTPFLPQRQTNVVANADIYDATYNPTGTLLFSGATNYSLCAGTGGTATASTNLTYVNSGLAQGSTLIRASSSATCTVTLSKENPRTDVGRSSGERQIIQIAASSGGSADEVYNFRFTPAIANVAVDDWYYAEASVEITAAPVNCNALELYLLETRPSNSQTAIDGAFNSSLAGQLASVTDKRVLRTPPIKRTSDATALQVNLRPRFKTDVGAAGITVAVADFVVRKLI
jgi:hypothetical protein